METIVKFISTIESRLSQLEVINGQLIFVEDSKKLYLDFENTRTQYGNFIFLATEIQRQGLKYPLSSFYFVYETNIIWRYDSGLGTWIQITSEPKEKVIFLDSGDFPAIGDPSRLYISGTDMYRWRDGEYQIIGSSYWKSLD